MSAVASPVPASPAGVLRSMAGGMLGSILSLAILLTLGIVAMTPLGTAAVATGVAAGFLCAVVSAGLYAFVGHSLMPAGGPSSATALLFASLAAHVVAAAPSGGPPPLAAVMVTTAGAVTVMGALQMLMAALRVGSLVRMVPQPVLGGFMNGIALLIFLSQLPALLALAPHQWHTEGWRALRDFHPGALVLGLGTTLSVWITARVAPRVPAALVGLTLGIAVYHVLTRLAPGLELGGTLGVMGDWLVMPGFLALGSDPEAGWSALQQHAVPVVVTGGLLALIATLESMLNLRSIDQELGGRHDQRRELSAMGLSNLIGGPLGALPMAHVRARAAVIMQVGGTGRSGAVGAVLASLLLGTVGLGLIGALPKAVLAGVMVHIAMSLLDRRSARLFKRLGSGPGQRSVRTSLLIMLLVCGLTVWKGPALGVGVGVVLSMLAFIQGMNRSLVRSRRDAVALPSRRVYRPELEALLETARRRVTVLELEGALFFGSAERVADEAEDLPPGTRFLVLDLRRVSTVDESAVAVLDQMAQRLARTGVELVLAGLAPGSYKQQQLQTFMTGRGGERSEGFFADVDRAVEHAERVLLAEAGAGEDLLSGELPLAQSTLLRGLSAAQVAAVSQHLQTRTLRAGERLFSEGDPGDGLFVLTQGSVSVISTGGQRFVSFSPATMLGELAMLDGEGRSAGAVADCDSVVHKLPREALAQLAQQDPALVALLYRNIGVHLAQRLRVASDAWRGAAA